MKRSIKTLDEEMTELKEKIAAGNRKIDAAKKSIDVMQKDIADWQQRVNILEGLQCKALMEELHLSLEEIAELRDSLKRNPIPNG